MKFLSVQNYSFLLLIKICQNDSIYLTEADKKVFELSKYLQDWGH